jgi:uncharacterized protein
MPSLPAGNFSRWLQRTKNVMRLPVVAADVPCGTCQGCCRASYFIHIRGDEKDTLARIPSKLRFAAPGLPKGHVVMGYNERGECPMLIDDACSIYEHRPQTCRDYDCRVLAATGIALDGQAQRLIAERVAQWKFKYENSRAQIQQAAIRRAARFLQKHRAKFPPDALPANANQLASYALRVYPIFMPGQLVTKRSVASIVEAVVKLASLA